MIADYPAFEAYLGEFTNYERLHAFNYDKHTLGLERIRSLLRDLGSPERSFPSVHIAGTKGKGSTSLILEALLRAQGFRVGTYTSPHVEHLRERIRIHGEPLAEADLVRELNGVLPALERRRAESLESRPTFFELMTALAMTAFRAQRVDWGIFEVGLGGRLDATNILAPSWTAITSIGLEHTQQLGNTLAAIAREKAGIIKRGTPLVLGNLPPTAATEVLAIAAEQQAPTMHARASLVASAGPGHIHLDGFGLLPARAVRGPALRADLAIALTLFEGILAAEGRRCAREVVAEALSSLQLPARVEVFDDDPPLVLDAAHTADSIQALRLTLEEIQFPRPRVLVFSLSAGKERESILPELPPIAEEIIFTLADPQRSIPPHDLQAQLGWGKVLVDPREALAEARRGGRPVVITGSFYLAGALRPLLWGPGRRAPEPSGASF